MTPDTWNQCSSWTYGSVQTDELTSDTDGNCPDLGLDLGLGLAAALTLVLFQFCCRLF